MLFCLFRLSSISPCRATLLWNRKWGVEKKMLRSNDVVIFRWWPNGIAYTTSTNTKTRSFQCVFFILSFCCCPFSLWISGVCVWVCVFRSYGRTLLTIGVHINAHWLLMLMLLVYVIPTKQRISWCRRFPIKYLIFSMLLCDLWPTHVLRIHVRITLE